MEAEDFAFANGSDFVAVEIGPRRSRGRIRWRNSRNGGPNSGRVQLSSEQRRRPGRHQLQRQSGSGDRLGRSRTGRVKTERDDSVFPVGLLVNLLVIRLRESRVTSPPLR
jgi:hypothetical protein